MKMFGLSASAIPFKVRQLLRCILAEALATCLLIVLATSGTDNIQLMSKHLRFGLSIMAVCVVTVRSNGAFQNPCIAVANWASGYEPSWQRTLALIIAEFLGALLAAVVLKTSPLQTTLDTCPISSLVDYVVYTMIASAMHVLVLLSVVNLNVTHGDPMYLYLLLPVLLGLSGTLGQVFTIGCSRMNPAFSLALALSKLNWENHWVEWMGPFSGVIFATVLHRFVFQPRKIVPTTSL